MVNIKSIQTMADRIAHEYDPERIILFGSYAYGSASASSDVDILVVMSFDGRNFRQSLDILNRINPPFATDILARKPEDTRRRYELGDPLIREALDRGKVLYERNR
jgi:predicted nucleotidyltransferase